MLTQNVSFEKVYDKFAIRIIYNSNQNNEKFLAWKIYSIVTDSFTPNPTRLRDWISAPNQLVMKHFILQLWVLQINGWKFK